jgi:copper chaperone
MNATGFRFKTTINCGSCIARVKGTLDELLGQGNWQVDTSSEDKLLETPNDSFDKEELIFRLAELGYAAIPVLK